MKDFQAYAKAASSVDFQNSSRTKFVKDEASGFSQVLYSRDWTRQDETLLRKSFWGAAVFGDQGQTYLKDLEAANSAPSKDASAVLSKLFKTRYMAIKTNFQYVGIWDMFNYL